MRRNYLLRLHYCRAKKMNQRPALSGRGVEHTTSNGGVGNSVVCNTSASPLIAHVSLSAFTHRSHARDTYTVFRLTAGESASGLGA